jgi:hypothetical protein
MKEELNTLKNLVSTLARNEGRPETIQSLTAEAKALPDTITANIFALSSDYQVRQYICWHLDMLVKEADLLYKCCARHPSRVLKKALVVILNLLKKLNQMFPEHADNTIPLPIALYQKEAARFKPLLAESITRFLENGIGEELSRIALFPLSNFLQKSAMPHRYCDYLYLLRFAAMLRSLDFRDRGKTPAGDLLCARLLRVNYNSIALMDYITAKVKMELEAAATKPEMELVLKRLRKWLKQVTVMSGIAYDPHFSNLKFALLDWTDEEAEALVLIDVAAPAAEPAKELEKLEISVGILAYLTRLSIAHGIRKVKPKTEIAEQIINTYCTKQTKRISKGSFINCYKAPRTGVAVALRKILRAMLADVDHFITTGEVREYRDETKK